MVKKYLILTALILSSCSSYDRFINADKYEYSCNDKVDLKLAKGMSIDRSSARKVTIPASDVNFKEIIKPPIN